MIKYSGANYSILFPDNWGFKNDPSCLTFYNNETGMLVQLSEYSKEDTITKEAIFDLLDITPQKNEYEERKYRKNYSIGFKENSESKFEGKLYIYRDRYMIFITYFYLKEDDIATLEQIVSSITFKNPENI